MCLLAYMNYMLCAEKESGPERVCITSRRCKFSEAFLSSALFDSLTFNYGRLFVPGGSDPLQLFSFAFSTFLLGVLCVEIRWCVLCAELTKRFRLLMHVCS